VPTTERRRRGADSSRQRGLELVLEASLLCGKQVEAGADGHRTLSGSPEIGRPSGTTPIARADGG
jgi:hypothetical protein